MTRAPWIDLVDRHPAWEAFSRIETMACMAEELTGGEQLAIGREQVEAELILSLARSSLTGQD
jgi:hypothetical protein